MGGRLKVISLRNSRNHDKQQDKREVKGKGKRLGVMGKTTQKRKKIPIRMILLF